LDEDEKWRRRDSAPFLFWSKQVIRKLLYLTLPVIAWSTSGAENDIAVLIMPAHMSSDTRIWMQNFTGYVPVDRASL
jgi:hypothetical protein